MLFIGDVHALWNGYQAITKSTEDDTRQIGDMGIGFGNRWPKKLPTKDRFIRGNHDHPDECLRHRNYLGDYGLTCSGRVFFMSGAWSIDRDWRTPLLDWWPDEELNFGKLQRAMTMYRDSKPAIVVTHDCPISILPLMFPKRVVIETRTSLALQEMLDFHRPDVWLFGHHHVLWKSTVERCQFICLDELSTHSIPELKWTNLTRPSGS